MGTEPNFETGDKVENLRRAHEPRKRLVQAPRRQDPEGRARDPRLAVGTNAKAREGMDDRERSYPDATRESPGEEKPRRATASVSA